MRIRLLAVLMALAALLGACGGGGDDTTSNVKDTSGVAASDAPGEGGDQQATEGSEGQTDEPGLQDGNQPQGGGASTPAAPGTTGGSAGGGGTSGGQGTVQEAKPGTVNEPKLGKYVYHVTGRATNPFATPDPTKPGQTNETKIDRDSTQEFVERKPGDKGVELIQRGGGQQGSQTMTYRWEAAQVLLTRTQFSGQQGSVDCKYNTPEGGLFITKVPVKAGALPKQEWSNDQCSGTHEVNVIGQEDVKDEAGKTWKTWKATVKTVLKIPAQQVEANINQTVWFSPDLGWQIKSDGRSDVKFGATSFDSDTVSILKSHP